MDNSGIDGMLEGVVCKKAKRQAITRQRQSDTEKRGTEKTAKSARGNEADARHHATNETMLTRANRFSLLEKTFSL